MGKKAKILVIAASIAAVLALSIGGIAVFASSNNTNNGAAQAGQFSGFGEGVSSEALSNLLGLTTEQIQALRHEGESLVQIAATKGISQQQLVDVIMAERKAVIQQMVTAGTLTQEQANTMLQQIEQNIIRAVNRTAIGRPEWAGAGIAGQGVFNGQLRTQQQETRGNGNGEPGLGTGPGNAHKWGATSR